MRHLLLGKVVRERITGLTGIVVTVSQWLTGCDTAGIQPQEIKDGKPVEIQWFDQTRLELLADQSRAVVDPFAERTVAPVPANNRGGPQPTPTRSPSEPSHRNG
jgi:hypothetical protein